MNTNDTNRKEMYTKKQNKNIRIISINSYISIIPSIE